MKTIRITGVPEHFNFPWVRIVASQPFLDEGIKLEWVNEPQGSGAMNKAIREGTTDIAIILTESFIKDKIEGNPGLAIGWHVSSPLVWGVHIPPSLAIEKISEISHPKFAISRMGSGSHLMAFLLAKREEWPTEEISFEVIKNLDGAKEAFKVPEEKMFLWEKYTTRPAVKEGYFKCISEIPTPWPCFINIAHPDILESHPDIIRRLKDLVILEATKLKQNPNLAEEIGGYYQLDKEDVKEWLSQTKWAEHPRISRKDIEKAQEILQDLGLIKEQMKIEEIIFKPFLEIY